MHAEEGAGRACMNDGMVKFPPLDIPTVSPLVIPLVYCHINSFQRASSVEKPWQGGEDRRDGRAAHHEEFEALGAFLLPCWATGMTLLAVRCRSGAPPRGQPWTPAVTLLHGCDGLNARRMAVW